MVRSTVGHRPARHCQRGPPGLLDRAQQALPRLSSTRPRPAGWQVRRDAQLASKRKFAAELFFMLQCLQLDFQTYTLCFMCYTYTYLLQGARSSSTKSVHSILHRTRPRHVCCRLREDGGITASTCSLACHINTASISATKDNVRGML